MGGLAIKKVIGNLSPQRLSKEHYEIVCERFKNYFDKLIQNEGLIGEYHIVESFSDKEDFGDMDVLVSLPRMDAFYNTNVMSNGGEFKFVSNGPVTSFVFTDTLDNELTPIVFQIDFIYTPPEEMEMAKFYHGKGDIGNLMGRIAHKMNLKLGHDGLWYIHRNETYVVGDILLSRDPLSILQFLGFDIKSMNDFHFNTLTEVFDFIISSPYFHWSFFELSLRNHTARVRDKKRPNYTGFIAYLKQKGLFEDESKPLVGKDYFLPALIYFDKMKDFSLLLEKEAMRLFSKAALNSSFIAQESGKKQQMLGNLMQELKVEFKSENIVKLPISQIRKDVSAFIKR
jgi:hypothetical protein